MDINLLFSAPGSMTSTIRLTVLEIFPATSCVEYVSVYEPATFAFTVPWVVNPGSASSRRTPKSLYVVCSKCLCKAGPFNVMNGGTKSEF